MLTLKELKKVVKVAGMTKRVPSEKALEKEEIVVKEILSGECDITVYANGYVLYRENGRKTIFPLHSCKDYQYMDVKEDRSIMNEEFFDNEEKIEAKYKGLEIERITPLSKLSYEELEFLDDYVVQHMKQLQH